MSDIREALERMVGEAGTRSQNAGGQFRYSPLIPGTIQPFDTACTASFITLS